MTITQLTDGIVRVDTKGNMVKLDIFKDHLRVLTLQYFPSPESFNTVFIDKNKRIKELKLIDNYEMFVTEISLHIDTFLKEGDMSSI